MKQLLTGLTVPRQYVCVALEDLSQPLSVFLTIPNSNHIQNVTLSHVFLGYKPLLMLLPLEESIWHKTNTVCLNFTQAPFNPDLVWKSFPSDSKCVARLTLQKKSDTPLIGKNFLFEGVYGEHHFINPVHQLINRLKEKLRKEDANNVSLPGNLHDQVRIAYSIPRLIPLITVGSNSAMNMFPTDLHGHVGENHYVSSLRKGGNANDQVDQHGKLAMSFMPAGEFQFVYSLGKNHMQGMSESKKFPIGKSSAVFGIPIPSAALRYHELKQINSIDAGIHRIHVYEKVNEEKLSDGKTLAHIHQYYAQWRMDHGLATPLLKH